MNEQQTQEAIALLHEARRQVQRALQGSPVSEEQMLGFLANSEDFMAESLGVKPLYPRGASHDPDLIPGRYMVGTTDALPQGYSTPTDKWGDHRISQQPSRLISKSEPSSRLTPRLESARARGAAAGLRGDPYESNPYPRGIEAHQLWSEAHNGARARKIMDEEGRDKDGAFIHGRDE